MSFRGRLRGPLMGERLALSGVCKGASDGRRPVQVLTDVSLEVASGEIVAVVGSHGMGKTTLLEIAAGLQLPDEGEVWLGDLGLTGLSGRERERLLGYVLAWTDRREPRLPWKALDYVALPLAFGRGHGRQEALGLAVSALERVGVGGSRCWSGSRGGSRVVRGGWLLMVCWMVWRGARCRRLGICCVIWWRSWGVGY
jgi:predicted ABC-type transport system involved in lysophospholipase L1 biosynthesis ATPase subunit